MTEILCNWLKDEVKLSQPIDKRNIGSLFSTGYLFGEVLSKYGLQDDFQFFSLSDTADSKLNNFTRIEPTLLLLGIPFDVNVAKEIMDQKSGTATRLLYQTYIALENKKKAGLTGVAMETMRPAAPAKLANMEIGLYRERLKQVTPRQTDINLQEIVHRFHQHRLKLEERAFNLRIQSAERHRYETEEHRKRMLDRSKNVRDQQKDLMERIEAAKVCIPKPPPNRTAEALLKKKTNRQQMENMQALGDLDRFDERLMRSLPSNVSPDSLEGLYNNATDNFKDDLPNNAALEWIKPASNENYIGRIRRRLEDDAHARNEREKRRRKVLVDCLNAHHKQAEEQREEALAHRLMRQSQIEKRIAVQLLQTRHEKAILKQNRMLREQQYAERREKEFIEALDKEKELYRQALLSCNDQLRAEQTLHDSLRAKKVEEKYRRNYEFCDGVLHSIVDMACRVAEYRQFLRSDVTNQQRGGQVKLPGHVYRNLLATFLHGQPFYEPNEIFLMTDSQMKDSMDFEDLMILKNEKEKVLDESELLEYRNMSGDWCLPANVELNVSLANPILGWIIDKLHKIVYPPPPPPEAPTYPSFPIKAAILGKSFSGKTSVIKQIVANNHCVLIQVDELVKEALKAFQEEETIHVEVEVPVEEDELSQPTSVDPDEPDEVAQVENSAREVIMKTKIIIEQHLSSRAQLGEKISDILKRGKVIEDQQMVDLISEYLTRLPNGCGWILDGFPATYNQAKLLEKALTGYNDDTVAVTKKSAKNKKSTATAPLTSTPRPDAPKGEPQSGLDTVILLDIEDIQSIKRATGRLESVVSQQQYHLLESPPPEGSITGMMGSVEVVKPTVDAANDMDQLQKRITFFLEAWPKLEKFYNNTFRQPFNGKFIKVIPAGQGLETLALEAENMLLEALNDKRLLQAGESLRSIAMMLEKKMESGELLPPPPPQAETTLPVVETPPVEAPPVETASGRKRPSSKKGSPRGGSRASSRKGSPKSQGSDSKKGAAGASKSSPRKASPRPGSSSKRQGSGSGGSKSPKRNKSATKRGKTPPREVETVDKSDSDAPKPPAPGSEDWKFVDLSLPTEVCSVLMHLWETIESSYLTNAQGMFRLLRGDRENIIQYFYRVRVHFLEYLRRPDTKQEFIAQFQKDFNEVSDDLRGDEETKQELYQRVEDLRDKLFEISDTRKEAAERRRAEIISSGWLDDGIGLLTNHYLSLMQGEFHRFQDTIRLLKDYYYALKSGTPKEYKPDYVRLPLLELPVEEDRGSKSRSEGDLLKDDTTRGTPTSTEMAQQSSARPTSGRSAKSGRTGTPKGGRKNSPSSKKGAKGNKAGAGAKEAADAKETANGGLAEAGIVELTDAEIEAMFKTRIPLLSLRPSSTDILNALNSTAPVASVGNATTGPGGRGAPNKGGKAAPAGKDKGGKAAAGMGAGATNSAGSNVLTDWLLEGPAPPNQPQDADLRTLHSSYKSGLNFITSVISQEFAQMEAAEELERTQQLEREKERERISNEKKAAAAKAAGGKAKGGRKSRTPSPKKRESVITPDNSGPANYATDEEKEDIEKSERLRKEYFAALLNEAKGCRVRMVLIIYVANAVIEDLKEKSENVHKDLLDWIGARILKENELIEGLTEVLRNAIENQERLKEKLQLNGDNFFVDRENTVVEPTSPPERPQPIDVIEANEFKIRQLRSIYQTLSRVAPSGHMAVSEFSNMLQELRDLCDEGTVPSTTTTTSATDVATLLMNQNSLPDPWKSALPTQLTELAELLSWDHEYVDWRRFLLSISMHAHPRASLSDLMNLLSQYNVMDQQQSGFITKEQYLTVPLWLEKDYRPPSTPLDPFTPKKIDRVSELKLLIFDMFKEHKAISETASPVEGEENSLEESRSIVVLNYKNMLMHFSAHPSAQRGLERALSVSVGKPLAHIAWNSRGNKDEYFLDNELEDDSEGSPNTEIPVECLYDVTLFGKYQKPASMPTSTNEDVLEDTVSLKEDSLRTILELSYRQLGSHDLSSLPYAQIVTHSYIVEILLACKQFQYIDPKQHIGDNTDANSSRTEKGNE